MTTPDVLAPLGNRPPRGEHGLKCLAMPDAGVAVFAGADRGEQRRERPLRAGQGSGLQYRRVRPRR